MVIVLSLEADVGQTAFVSEATAIFVGIAVADQIVGSGYGFGCLKPELGLLNLLFGLFELWKFRFGLWFLLSGEKPRFRCDALFCVC